MVVLYDASVLYPSTLRDLLIRLAQSGLVTAKWTDRILDEVFDSLARDRPDLDPVRLLRTRTLMVRAVRDCLVQKNNKDEEIDTTTGAITAATVSGFTIGM
ncbi:MAG TPA: hypothetical protein VLM05_01155 [Mycobacteriales bacterium]|nr:hypothetical protein [Mycobacteriales bacterium]